MANLYKTFREEVLTKLQRELGIKNPMAAPKLVKIVMNMGLKEGLKDQKIIEDAVSQMTFVAGQKAVVTRAKKAIAGFKLRKGDPIGVMVTLRGNRMYDFFEKLVKIVLPRVRDFHGVPSTSFDGYGNYTLGFQEIGVFSEIDTNKITKNYGMEVTINTTAKTDEEARKLLELLGMPFKKTRSETMPAGRQEPEVRS